MPVQKITLRLNWGSFREVARVFAYDADQRRASVLLKGFHGGIEIETVQVDELEALNEKREFVPVDTALRQRAEVII